MGFFPGKYNLRVLKYPLPASIDPQSVFIVEDGLAQAI